jgi:hypothetical protein
MRTLGLMARPDLGELGLQKLSSSYLIQPVTYNDRQRHHGIMCYLSNQMSRICPASVIMTRRCFRNQRDPLRITARLRIIMSIPWCIVRRV